MSNVGLYTNKPCFVREYLVYLGRHLKLFNDKVQVEGELQIEVQDVKQKLLAKLAGRKESTEFDALENRPQSFFTPTRICDPAHFRKPRHAERTYKESPLNIARSYPLLHVSSGCICPKNTRRRNQNYGQQRKSTFHRPVVLRIDLGVPRISCTPRCSV